jgi:hypothetical protein
MNQVKKNLSPAQVFERGERHLLKQAVRSGEENCSLYRCEDGRACPVGSFIPLSVNTKYLEGLRVTEPEVQEALSIVVTPKVLKVLRILQDIHDLADPADWRSRLYGAAIKLGFINPGRITKKPRKGKK